MNAQLRDNLLETAAAKATQAGTLFVGSGVNQLVERLPVEVMEYARESGTQTGYGNIPGGTVGPEYTVTTSNRAMIGVTAGMLNNTAGQYTCMSFLVYIGGTATVDVAADDNYALVTREDSGASTAAQIRASSFRLLNGLTPQSNRFMAKYRVSGGTGTWDDRGLIIIPL